MGEQVLQAGSKLGRYTLIRRIGAGGMAEVFLASQEGAAGFAREVAIKVVRPGDGDSQLLSALADEAQLAAQLAHPNIVQVIDFGMHGDGFYLVMEYLPGLTLDQLVKLGGGAGKALDLGVIVDVGIQVLDALDFAHSATDSSGRSLAVVHRDVKPANIMVSPIGLVKLLDFGIARATSIERRTATGMSKGTPAYMAPEQLRGQEVGPLADLFAVGVLLFELAVGRSLFTGGSFMDLVQRRIEGFNEDDRADLVAVQPALLDLVERGLKNDPAERWPDARSMLSAVRALSTANVREPLCSWMKSVGSTSGFGVPIISTSDVEVIEPTMAAPEVATPASGEQVGSTRAMTGYPEGAPAQPEHAGPAGATRLQVRSDPQPIARLKDEKTTPGTGDLSPRRSRGAAALALVGILAIGGLWLAQAGEPAPAPPPAPTVDLNSDASELSASTVPLSQPDERSSTPVPIAAPASEPTTSQPTSISGLAKPVVKSAAEPVKKPGARSRVNPVGKPVVKPVAKPVAKPRQRETKKVELRLESAPVVSSGSVAVEASTQTVGSGSVWVAIIGGGGTVHIPEVGTFDLPKDIGVPAGTRRFILRDKRGAVLGRYRLEVRPGDDQQCVWTMSEDGKLSLVRRSTKPCRLK